MGILDDYMTGSTTAPTASQAFNSSLINSYINTVDEPKKVNTVVKPPISGVSKEASDRINAETAQKGGANPRSAPSLTQSIADQAMSGVQLMGEGVSDVFSNKSASGVGKAALGALAVPGSLITGPADYAKKLTGSDALERAMLVLPVAPASKAAVSKVPGLDKLEDVPVLNKLQNVKGGSKDKALRNLVADITAEGRNPQALVDTINAMKADKRIGPADTSPVVLNTTQDLFVREGAAAKDYLFNTSKGRLANLPEDVKKAYDVTGGTPVNVLEKLNALAAAQKKAGNDLINPALANAKPVNISPVIDHIDAVLKPGILKEITGETTLPFSKVKQALNNVKAMIANNKEQLTDPQSLHTFQSALRREAENRLKSADGGERQLGQALMAVRNRVVNAIDEASPRIVIDGKEVGQYKAGLAKYREESHIGDAFRDGYNGVFSNSTKMENRPDFTRQWFNGLTDAEKEAAKEGARLAIDSKMGASGNASLAGTRLAQSDFNREKLEIIFGKQETATLLHNLENTRSIKNTDQMIIEGSQTAARIAGGERTKLSKDMPTQEGIGKYAYPALAAAGEYFTGATGAATAATLALAGATKLGSKAKAVIIDKLEKERNLNYAKMAMPVEGPSRDKLIKDLESFLPSPKPSMLARIASKMPIAP